MTVQQSAAMSCGALKPTLSSPLGKHAVHRQAATQLLPAAHVACAQPRLKRRQHVCSASLDTQQSSAATALPKFMPFTPQACTLACLQHVTNCSLVASAEGGAAIVGLLVLVNDGWKCQASCCSCTLYIDSSFCRPLLDCNPRACRPVRGGRCWISGTWWTCRRAGWSSPLSYKLRSRQPRNC